MIAIYYENKIRQRRINGKLSSKKRKKRKKVEEDEKEELVSKLVGALSPVNHTGLHQG